MPRLTLNQTICAALCALIFAVPVSMGNDLTVDSKPYFWSYPRTAERILLAADQKPARSKILHVVDDVEWRTSVLFGREDFFEKSKGVIIMVPGMGGNVAKYGVAYSTKLFADIALKLNFYPVAVQNRVYQHALNPNWTLDMRRQHTKELRDLNFEMGEFYQMVDRATAVPIENGKQRYLYGRSNGTGKILEMLHRMASGDDNAIAAGSKIDAVYWLVGIVTDNPALAFGPVPKTWRMKRTPPM